MGVDGCVGCLGYRAGEGRHTTAAPLSTAAAPPADGTHWYAVRSAPCRSSAVRVLRETASGDGVVDDGRRSVPSPTAQLARGVALPCCLALPAMGVLRHCTAAARTRRWRPLSGPLPLCAPQKGCGPSLGDAPLHKGGLRSPFAALWPCNSAMTWAVTVSLCDSLHSHQCRSVGQSLQNSATSVRSRPIAIAFTAWNSGSHPARFRQCSSSCDYPLHYTIITYAQQTPTSTFGMPQEREGGE